MIHSSDIVVYCGGGRINRFALPTLEAFNSYRIGEPDISISHINFSTFRDGEDDTGFARPGNLDGRHAIFFMTGHTDHLIVQDLPLLWATKQQYDAKSLTLVMPFFPFRRQDHPEIKTEIHRNRWFVETLRNCGVDTLVVCDIHSDQTIINGEAVGLRVINVDPTPAYVAALMPVIQEAKQAGRRVLVVALDKGSLRRAVQLAKAIGSAVLANAKKRGADGRLNIRAQFDESMLEYISSLQAEYEVQVIWENYEDMVKDAVTIMREDELDSGATSAGNARLLLAAGAQRVYLAVTHMRCSLGWRRSIGLIPAGSCPFTRIFGGDTFYRGYENSTGGLIKDVPMANVVANALVELMKEE